jgi:hypothetical protein
MVCTDVDRNEWRLDIFFVCSVDCCMGSRDNVGLWRETVPKSFTPVYTQKRQRCNCRGEFSTRGCCYERRVNIDDENVARVSNAHVHLS